VNEFKNPGSLELRRVLVSPQQTDEKPRTPPPNRPGKKVGSLALTALRNRPTRSTRLFEFFSSFFPITLSCESLLDALLFPRLHEEGMALHFFDDVFLLDFALESPKCIFNTLTFLQSNFSHSRTPPICDRLLKITQLFYFNYISSVKENLDLQGRFARCKGAWKAASRRGCLCLRLLGETKSLKLYSKEKSESDRTGDGF
jgi:hypothetical protein